MNFKHLELMLHSPIHNYIVPGLTSWLVGTPGPQGTVRMFHMKRHQNQVVTPHSHRYALTCHVLEGAVENTIYTFAPDGDEFMASSQTYKALGKYDMETMGSTRRALSTKRYEAGEWYAMSHVDVHSIVFGRGAKVLVFEGPSVAEHSVILEPIVDSITIPMHRTEPWMFV